MVETSDWITINVSMLKNELEAARTNHKHLLIWDQKGVSMTYFKYMERMYSVSAGKIKVQLGQRNLDDILKEIRKTVIGAMRCGQA